MRRCPNLGCPFRVRHGFAAELEDRVERCPSCDAALSAPEAEPAARSAADARAGASFGGLVLGRLVVSVLVFAALLGFARLPVPGYEALAEIGFDTSFFAVSLRRALSWLIGSVVVVELGALLIPGAQNLRHELAGRETLRAISLVLALAGVALLTYLQYRRLHAAVDGVSGLAPFAVDIPGLAWMLLTATVGLPLLLGLATANDRWGLGHGISLVVAALLTHELLVKLRDQADPVEHGALTLGLIIALGIALSWPTRAQASGRSGDAGEALGLGLTVPSTGLLPIVLLALIPLTPTLLATLPGLPNLLPLLGPLYDWTGQPPALPLIAELGLVAALSGGFAWLFTRPRLLVERWRRAFPKAETAALEREAAGLFRRTLLRSALLMLVLVLLLEHGFASATALILAAVALDFIAELRLRARLYENRDDGHELVEIPAPLDVPAAESLATALRLEDRPALISGLHHRALYHLFGTWIPLRALVREQDRERAEQLRDELLEPRDELLES